MNLFKTINDINKVKSKMDWALKKDIGYQIEMFLQSWSNSTGGYEEVGEDIVTEQMTYVVYNIEFGNAYIFFDGNFAYKTEINDKFLEDLKSKSIVGIKSYWKRYDMDKFWNLENNKIIINNWGRESL
ncbi:TPA: hypothetical protein N2D99_002283 [Clostridium botulinum]|nr:hypothetical protein [Clostridium botulinum]